MGAELLGVWKLLGAELLDVWELLYVWVLDTVCCRLKASEFGKLAFSLAKNFVENDGFILFEFGQSDLQDLR